MAANNAKLPALLQARRIALNIAKLPKIIARGICTFIA
jgi:hypothetical protein